MTESKTTTLQNELLEPVSSTTDIESQAQKSKASSEDTAAAEGATEEHTEVVVSATYKEIVYHFFILGWTAFGGPAAHIGMFQKVCLQLTLLYIFQVLSIEQLLHLRDKAPLLPTFNSCLLPPVAHFFTLTLSCSCLLRSCVGALTTSSRSY